MFTSVRTPAPSRSRWVELRHAAPPATGRDSRSGLASLRPGGVDPVDEFRRVETQEVAPLDVGDSALSNKTADMADVHPEVSGHSVDVEQDGHSHGAGVHAPRSTARHLRRARHTRNLSNEPLGSGHRTWIVMQVRAGPGGPPTFATALTADTSTSGPTPIAAQPGPHVVLSRSTTTAPTQSTPGRHGRQSAA